jgi:hypothetical protein
VNAGVSLAACTYTWRAFTLGWEAAGGGVVATSSTFTFQACGASKGIEGSRAQAVGSAGGAPIPYRGSKQEHANPTDSSGLITSDSIQVPQATGASSMVVVVPCVCVCAAVHEQTCIGCGDSNSAKSSSYF